MLGITASIVVYENDLDILDQAIKSCLNSDLNLKLFVIDNSCNNHAGKLCSNNQIEYIHNPKNIGFGKAHNIALKTILTTSKYHIIINPDVFFDNKVIPELHAYMEKRPDVGMVMPKVLYPDGRLQYLCKLLPKPQHLIYRRLSKYLLNSFAKYNEYYEMHSSGYNSIINVPFVSGCFMFIRMEALQKVGLFDERIFLYTEDIDLSRRVNKFYKTQFFPYVHIYHYHAAHSYKSLRILGKHIESAIGYFNKWGWFNDRERDLINEQIVKQYKVLEK